MLPRERQVHLNKPTSTICIILASVTCAVIVKSCNVTESRKTGRYGHWPWDRYRQPLMSPGGILGSRLNRQLSERGVQRLVRYAAMARAGIGPGFHGSGIKGAIRTILSDPQRPHRCRVEDETILQFSQ